MSVIDLNVINNLKSMGKDKTFLVSVIDLFVKETPISLAEIDKGFKSKNAESLRSAVHKYKSSSRNVGAMTLSNLCLDVEVLAKEGKHTTADVTTKIAKIKTESATAIKALQDIKTAYLKS